MPTSATSRRPRTHLAQCKYKPEDFNLELSWVGEVPLEERFALLMQANFAEIGIKSEIKKLPWALFSEQVTKPENTPNISQVFVNARDRRPRYAALRHVPFLGAPGTWQSPEYLKDAEVDETARQGPHASPSDEERGRAAYTSSASGCASLRRRSSPTTRRPCLRRASACRCRRCPIRQGVRPEPVWASPSA